MPFCRPLPFPKTCTALENRREGSPSGEAREAPTFPPLHWGLTQEGLLPTSMRDVWHAGKDIPSQKHALHSSPVLSYFSPCIIHSDRHLIFETCHTSISVFLAVGEGGTVPSGHSGIQFPSSAFLLCCKHCHFYPPPSQTAGCRLGRRQAKLPFSHPFQRRRHRAACTQGSVSSERRAQA